MYVTAGRVGSYSRKHQFFRLYRYGVKLYKAHITRKGTAVYRYVGFVPETVTLDRWVRDKKYKLAEAYATEKGLVYRINIRHNQPLPILEALCSIDPTL